MGDAERRAIERLFVEIKAHYGFDFCDYAFDSARRRVLQRVELEGLAGVEELLDRVLLDEAAADRLVRALSINVTEMFRDPLLYVALRQQVLPAWSDSDHIKIWHAGCASGEEAYSMAILLKEEGVFDRSTLFGTDFNRAVLEQAKKGILPLEAMKKNIRNYQLAGGKQQFADYYRARYAGAALDQSLKQRIHFAHHNLTQDGPFGEMHMIVCRNVLIYFNRQLKERVVQLFFDSLSCGGLLCLGSQETLRLSSLASQFETVNADQRIYRKVKE